MGKITDLDPNDRGEIQVIIDQIVGDQPSVSVTEVMRQVVSEVSRLEETGIWWAPRALRALASDGVRSLVKSRLEEDRASITVATSGRVISVPARLGGRSRKDDGTAGVTWRQTLWWEMDWPVLDEAMQERVNRRDGLSAEITAWREVKQLQERFPESATPGEACEQAGIDPRKFAIQ